MELDYIYIYILTNTEKVLFLEIYKKGLTYKERGPLQTLYWLCWSARQVFRIIIREPHWEGTPYLPHGDALCSSVGLNPQNMDF